MTGERNQTADEGPFDHTMSSTPPPVKSPAAGRALSLRFEMEDECEPSALKSQIESAAVPGAYQKMSSTPSPVKSPLKGSKVPLLSMRVKVEVVEVNVCR